MAQNVHMRIGFAQILEVHFSFDYSFGSNITIINYMNIKHPTIIWWQSSNTQKYQNGRMEE